jgi:hypothetical protein
LDHTLHKKAQLIYTQFSKAPVLEMVQYMVDHSVDAQILNELKIIDSKHPKNAYVKSYAERIYDSYERICKVLVTYPSLEFKDCEFKIKKNKSITFIAEFFGGDSGATKDLAHRVIDILNISLTNAIESNDLVEQKIAPILRNANWVERIHRCIKEASGEDYTHFFQSINHG